MLSSIHPLGERGRNNSYRSTVLWHLLGAAAGGVAFGSLLGAFGAFVWADATPSARAVPIAALVAVGVIGDLVGIVPTGQRQVDEGWLTEYRPWVYAGGYGVQLGVGVATVVSSWAVVLPWGIAALSGSTAIGAVVGGAYGLVRGGSVVTTRHIHSPEALRSYHRRLDASARWARPTTLVAMAAIGSAAVGVAVF